MIKQKCRYSSYDTNQSMSPVAFPLFSCVQELRNLMHADRGKKRRSLEFRRHKKALGDKGEVLSFLIICKRCIWADGLCLPWPCCHLHVLGMSLHTSPNTQHPHCKQFPDDRTAVCQTETEGAIVWTRRDFHKWCMMFEMVMKSRCQKSWVFNFVPCSNQWLQRKNACNCMFAWGLRYYCRRLWLIYQIAFKCSSIWKSQSDKVLMH